MIKIKHGNHELVSSDTQQFYHAAYAYVHALIKFLISEISKTLICRITAFAG
jgi:hypothetical protein